MTSLKGNKQTKNAVTLPLLAYTKDFADLCLHDRDCVILKQILHKTVTL